MSESEIVQEKRERLHWRVWGWLRAELSDPRDWHNYGGLFLVSYGGWMLMPAAGFIVAGLGLIFLSLRYGGTGRD